MTWPERSTSFAASVPSVTERVTYERYLESHGSLTYRIRGTSMLPLLREGRDLFTVVAKGDRRSRVGDVVLYRRPPDEYVLHRIVEVLPGAYLILGDNCLTREFVPESEVIGVLSSFVRDGRGYGVDCTGYRAYSWLWLRFERPRVAVRRLALGIARRVRAAHGRHGDCDPAVD